MSRRRRSTSRGNPPRDASGRGARETAGAHRPDADAEPPGAPILILGDYNDTPGSPALLAIGGSEPDRYVDVATALSAPFTYDHAGQHELIDHAMANATLLALLDPASVSIVHSPATRAASDHAPLLARFAAP